jgi:putative thioredoxin
VTEARGKVRLVKIDVDKNQMIAAQMRVQSIPAVFAFVNGQPVDGFVGALPESQVRAFIERLAGPTGPSEEELLIEEGDALLAAGDVVHAAERFAAALANAPQSVAAIVGLARCHLARGGIDAARQTLAALPESAASDPAVAVVRAQLNLAAQTAGLGDPAVLAARVAADPKDHQARFDLALILNAKGDREGATDRLLEIVAKDRSWNDEKARKQLVQFFEAWGPTDAATVSGRRRLASVLFA